MFDIEEKKLSFFILIKSNDSVVFINLCVNIKCIILLIFSFF